MQLPQWLAKTNRYTTNPLMRLWAGWMPMMGILEHHGRRSGKAYRTPLTVFSTEHGVAVLLTYGPDRDWLKNLNAAGSARMQRYGKTFTVTDPRVVTPAEAAASVPGLFGRLLPIAPFSSALLLTRA